MKKWLHAYLYHVLAFNVLTCPPFRRRVGAWCRVSLVENAFQETKTTETHECLAFERCRADEVESIRRHGALRLT